jgi:Uma2 family endonuclease
MATVATPVSRDAMPRPLPVHRFSVEQYHRMIEAGVLTPNDRVELLEGWVVDKMPQHPAHAGTISVVHGELTPRLPKGWIIRIQSPITLEDSEPEPDLTIARGPEKRYLTAHPKPEEIALLIEVSDTSVDYDRIDKGRAYARARIPVYWVVNLVEFAVEVYSEPKAGKSAGYRNHQRFGIEFGAPIVIAGRDGGAIPVRHLFP